MNSRAVRQGREDASAIHDVAQLARRLGSAINCAKHVGLVHDKSPNSQIG